MQRRWALINHTHPGGVPDGTADHRILTYDSASSAWVESDATLVIEPLFNATAPQIRLTGHSSVDPDNASILIVAANSACIPWAANDGSDKGAFMTAAFGLSDPNHESTWEMFGTGAAETPHIKIVAKGEVQLLANKWNFAATKFLGPTGGDVQFRGYFLPNTTTTAALDAVGNAINTAAGKVQGAMVYNTDTDNPVYAVGNADGDIWVDGKGDTAHSPA